MNPQVKRYRVGVHTAPRGRFGVNTQGWLSIESGVLRARAIKGIAFLIGLEDLVHTQRQVRWHRTRINFPWLGDGPILESADGDVVRVFPSRWKSTQVKREIESAGFELIPEVSWFESRKTLRGDNQ